MRHQQRVFFSDNGVFTGQSIKVNDFRKSDFAMTYVATEDYLYVGGDLPFNSRFFELSTVNATAADVNVEIWDGSSWEGVVDIIDYTQDAGASLGKSGYITWSIDVDEQGWGFVSDPRDEEPAFGLDTPIFNFYWARFSWDASFSASIKYIGHRFCDDDQLYAEYPDFNNSVLRDRWEQGSPSGTKTDWKEQEFLASEKLLRDLKSSGVIISPNQVLDFEIFEEMAIHKTAEIIYGGMGSSHRDDMARARERYLEARKAKHFNTDQNATGNLERTEKRVRTGFSSR